MKKFIALLVLGVSTIFMTGCSSEEATVALVTDAGTINDGSFNESAYNGIKEYCEANDVSYKYYQPVKATDEERWNSIQLAVRGGAKIVVLPGYLFNTIICDASIKFTEVKFLLLDGSYEDDTSFGEVYDSTKTYDNVYCVNYHEEQSGFLAGYAAVQEGYTKLGFLGGMAVPAVIRFGYGFIQGAEAAAIDLGIDVTVNYYYAGHFEATLEATNKMKDWADNGTEVVFACGGGVWNSVKDAVTTTNGLKMIGVDVNQEDDGQFVITSAMKGLKDTVLTTLNTVFDDEWDTVSGKIESLGLGNVVGGVTYVGLPTDEVSWRFESFTVEEYNKLVEDLQRGNYTVETTTDVPTSSNTLETILGLTKVTVSYQ